MKITADDFVSQFIEVIIDGEKNNRCTVANTDEGTVDRYIDNERGGCVIDPRTGTFITETVKCNFKLKTTTHAPEWVVDWFNTNVPEDYKLFTYIS